jgi:hypothetical protein
VTASLIDHPAIRGAHDPDLDLADTVPHAGKVSSSDGARRVARVGAAFHGPVVPASSVETRLTAGVDLADQPPLSLPVLTLDADAPRQEPALFNGSGMTPLVPPASQESTTLWSPLSTRCDRGAQCLSEDDDKLYTEYLTGRAG